MPFRIRRVDYFYATVPGQPGAACELLRQLAGLGINLLAFCAVPMGPMRTQLTLFPHDRAAMANAARNAGLAIDGPHPAILVQGDDELGALAGVHQRLDDADVAVFAAEGVADGQGSFGYVVYVRPQDIDKAVEALAATG
ncbi:MAG: hypothetical protein FJ265_09775 [Planctomycetes bacterium]|nr:hypothetical protein [Planctomycetota bacterium]